MPSHHRMRAFDRDLIRGGHYGQRSCEPHLKAEHMAAPTKTANVKKALANPEPSTHGIASVQTHALNGRYRKHSGHFSALARVGSEAIDPERSSASISCCSSARLVSALQCESILMF